MNHEDELENLDEDKDKEIDLETSSSDALLDTFSRWPHVISKIPLLSAEEEIILAKAMEGDMKAIKEAKIKRLIPQNSCVDNAREDARKKFIEANYRLVIVVAKRYRGMGIQTEDLIQEGIIGLMKAVDKFNWRMGNRFATYAVSWIAQGIRRCLDQQSRMMRLPAYIIMTISKPSKNNRNLYFFPRDDESLIWLDNPADKHIFRSEDPYSVIPDKSNSDILEKMTLKDEIRHCLLGLNTQEREVIKLRYGLSGDKELTLREIGSIFGVTRERIRQIEVKSMKKLQGLYKKPKKRR